MTTTLEDLISSAVATYKFRRRLWNETPAAYRVALIQHVEMRDFSAANEIRLGKPIHEWTPEEIAAYRDRLVGLGGPRQQFAPGERPPDAAPIVELHHAGTATDDTLDLMARRGHEATIARRIAQPNWEMPIFVTVLLLDARVLCTTTARGDRVALVKWLIQRYPVFGFFVAFDMWMHTMTDTGQNRAPLTGPMTPDATAGKSEAIGMHIGTRERRICRIAEYRRTPAGIQFKDPIEFDMRGPDVRQDPYAAVFVSVPPSGRPA